MRVVVLNVVLIAPRVERWCLWRCPVPQREFRCSVGGLAVVVMKVGRASVEIVLRVVLC